MKRLLVVLYAVLLFGCGAKEPIPDDILKPEVLTPVMADLMYYQEALRMQAMKKDSATAVFQELITPEVLDKYGISQADFDRSVAYYRSDVERYDDMWRSVVDSLSLRVQLSEMREKGDSIQP